MKKIFTLVISTLISVACYSQINLKETFGNVINENLDKSQSIKDSIKKSLIFYKDNEQEAVWDNGVPIIPDDDRIMNLVYQLNESQMSDVTKLTKEQVRIYRELGLEFYSKGMYQEADFYLSKIKDYKDKTGTQLKEVFTDDPNKIRKQIKDELDKEYKEKLSEIQKPEEKLTLGQLQSLKNDTEFLKNLPKEVDNLTKEDLERLSQQIDGQIQKLTKERDNLIKNNGSQELIDSKNVNIKSLKKEKQVIDLSIDKEQLKEEKTIIKRWLWGTAATIALLILSILAILQRRTIRVQDKEIEKQLQDISKKNTYLEHAARIIRHDMHSGINTYIPRGINSLEKRLTVDEIKNLKIDGSVKMIKEGLNHTQKVYKSVYEFTNLVKQNVVLDKSNVSLKDLIEKQILTTSYSNQVVVEELTNADVNETLFWNAIDNIIKNGLKYNKSDNKFVRIYMEDSFLVIQDNGIGLSQKKFDKILKQTKSDEDSGLGINICNAILTEHGFSLSCEEISNGTKMKIKL